MNENIVNMRIFKGKKITSMVTRWKWNFNIQVFIIVSDNEFTPPISSKYGINSSLDMIGHILKLTNHLGGKTR